MDFGRGWSVILRKTRGIALVAILAGQMALPALGESVSGAYLAARQAGMQNDFGKAADYYSIALARDPGNPRLLENTLVSFMAMGAFEKALPIARKMVADGRNSQMANMILLGDLARKEDYAAILKSLEEGERIGPLVDGLLKAWAEMGTGRVSDALESFDQVIAAKGSRAFGLYHKALAIASAGDFAGADEIFAGKAGASLRMTRRGVIAHAQILSQLERNKDALKLIETAFGSEPDPLAEDLRARLEAGERLPFRLVVSPREGMAEVFYTLAGALRGEAGDTYTLIYSRMAQMLNPDHAEAVLMTAQILERLGNHDLAIETYKLISPDDPARVTAEIGRANAMRKAGREDAAIEVLEQLAKAYPDLARVHVSLGDIYRQAKKFDKSAKAYSRAIELVENAGGADWFIYYARGIAHERLGKWDLAEADLRQALALEPDQPNVLNYLGYSLVDKNMKLEEALEMIRKAVAARPDDGYITDSLGWALYRLGRYEEAVRHMERAAELTPTDPIINDHLGDVYWAVGRNREARVQWQRALSFDPEEKERKRILRKLEVGLDAVLEAEGARPLAMSNNEN